MRSKKADLMNNVLTTVIAVAGLFIIFFAAWQLYSVYIKQDERNAQSDANLIEAKINALKEGKDYENSVPMDLMVRGIESWFVAGWGKEDMNRPAKCYFKSCVCVCLGKSVDWKKDTTISGACQDKGFCRLLDADKVLFSGQTVVVGVDEEDDQPIRKILPAVSFEKSQFIELTVRKYVDKNEHIVSITPKW